MGEENQEAQNEEVKEQASDLEARMVRVQEALVKMKITALILQASANTTLANIKDN